MCRAHLSLNPRIQRNAKISRLRNHRTIIKRPKIGPRYFGEDAIINLAVGTSTVGEQGEISQRRTSAGAGVMHEGEARHVGAIEGEAALVALRVGIGYGFCHAVGEGGAGKDIAAVAGSDERVDVLEVSCPCTSRGVLARSKFGGSGQPEGEQRSSGRRHGNRPMESRSYK